MFSFSSIASEFRTEPLFTPDILAKIEDYKAREEAKQKRQEDLEQLGETRACEHCQELILSTFVFCDMCGKPRAAQQEQSVDSSDCDDSTEGDSLSCADSASSTDGPSSLDITKFVPDALPVTPVVVVAVVAEAAPVATVVVPKVLKQRAPSVQLVSPKKYQVKKMQPAKMEMPGKNECWDWKKKGYCKSKKCQWEHTPMWKGYSKK